MEGLLDAPTSLLSYEVIAQLKEIIRKLSIDKHALTNLYKQSVSTTYYMENNICLEDSEFIEPIIEQLAEAPIQNGKIVPLLKFLDLLEKNTGINTIKTEISLLKQKVSNQLSLTTEQETNSIFPLEIEIETENQYDYLLVKVEPKGKSNVPISTNTKCLVQAWLITNNEKRSQFDSNGKTIKGIGKLPEVFQELYNKLNQLSHTRIIIEVFLPRDFFSDPIDQKPIIIGINHPSRIGNKYPIIIRYLERLSPMGIKKLQPQWKRQWRNLQESNTPSFLEVDKMRASCKESLGAYLDAKNKYCIKANFSALDNHTEMTNLIETMLDLGIPIAVWARKSSSNLSILTEKLCTLAKIPTNIRDLRLEATEKQDDNHIGNHISLLWDDPNRLPPELDYEKKNEVEFRNIS